MIRSENSKKQSILIVLILVLTLLGFLTMIQTWSKNKIAGHFITTGSLIYLTQVSSIMLWVAVINQDLFKLPKAMRNWKKPLKVRLPLPFMITILLWWWFLLIKNIQDSNGSVGIYMTKKKKKLIRIWKKMMKNLKSTMMNFINLNIKRKRRK